MIEKERNALQDFLYDIHCLDALENWKDDVNIFDILKVTNAEIRHSNFLAWLLDPNENHNLGDAFIKGVISGIVQRCSSEMCDPFDILLQDFFTYRVYREANHMDIVLVSNDEKTAIIIENKVWSGESSNQLSIYEKKSKQDYPQCEHFLYVFLTPDGHESSNPHKWISISYEDIVNALENAIKGKTLTPESLLVIKNYINIVRKRIMKERDEALVSICNEIYNKHRTALRLIFENVQIDNSADSEIICNELKKLSDEGKILYYGNNSWSFFTESMDAYLPLLEDTNSSWGTNWVYYYWFEKTSEHLVLHFELGGSNITEQHKAHMRALINVAGKKEDAFKYKRLLYKKEKLDLEDYEDSLKKAVRVLVTGALAEEQKWLDAINAGNK